MTGVQTCALPICLAQQEAVAKARQAEEQTLLERRETVRQLVGTARQLVYEGNYRQALGVINQILAIDPTNDYAIGVRQFVSDYAVMQDQRFFREQQDREWERAFNAAEEAKIPYTDLMVYPRNWPDISETRDRDVAAERRGGADDLAVRAQLDRRLPEIRFDQVAFGDVVDFLRDVTGANLFVNWRALEAAGVERTAPVTARLRDVRFSKALSTILNDVGGGTVALAYTVDEGVITISTAEDLNKNVDIQVYDIRDLLVIPPDIDKIGRASCRERV